MTWIRIRIHFFERRIQDPDPDPHQNVMDPKHWFQEINYMVQVINSMVQVINSMVQVINYTYKRVLRNLDIL